MPKTIVTGGAGFVGGHLCKKLVELGHEVLAIDDLSAGRREYVPIEAEFSLMDLGSVPEKTLIETVQGFAPDNLVHLAAIHFIPRCISDPGATFAANVRSTEVLVRALADLPARKMVSISSMDVYPPLDRVHNERDETGPCNPYGISKLLSEHLVAYASRIHPTLHGVSLRFSNIYGPQETNSHFIPRVLELLDESDLPEIRLGYLGGSRDFIHVFDIVRAIIVCLTQDSPKYECFNVGTGIATPVRDVVSILMAARGDCRPVIEDKAKFRTFDRVSLTADVEKITSMMGWCPQIDLADGLRDLIQSEQRHAVSA